MAGRDKGRTPLLATSALIIKGALVKTLEFPNGRSMVGVRYAKDNKFKLTIRTGIPVSGKSSNENWVAGRQRA